MMPAIFGDISHSQGLGYFIGVIAFTRYNDNDNDNDNILFDHNIKIYTTNLQSFINQNMN